MNFLVIDSISFNISNPLLIAGACHSFTVWLHYYNSPFFQRRLPIPISKLQLWHSMKDHWTNVQYIFWFTLGWLMLLQGRSIHGCRTVTISHCCRYEDIYPSVLQARLLTPGWVAIVLGPHDPGPGSMETLPFPFISATDAVLLFLRSNSLLYWWILLTFPSFPSDIDFWLLTKIIPNTIWRFTYPLVRQENIKHISSFLCNRSIPVIINWLATPSLLVISGVPQGSLLSLLPSSSSLLVILFN